MSSSNIEEFICPICREILMKPVTLPCKHTCCYDCLEKTLDSNKYQCFFCRKFIGSWYRNAKRKRSIIDEKLWALINKNFGDIVNQRINGESIDLIFERFPTTLSAPGEIKQEFEVCVEKIMKENRVQQEKEEKLSEDLIKKLQNEEEEYNRRQEELRIRDEEIAKNLFEELNSTLVTREKNCQVQVQLSEDEKLARALAQIENLSSPPIRNKTLRSFTKNQKSCSKRVSNGPMDRFLEKKGKF